MSKDCPEYHELKKTYRPTGVNLNHKLYGTKKNSRKGLRSFFGVMRRTQEVWRLKTCINEHTYQREGIFVVSTCALDTLYTNTQDNACIRNISVICVVLLILCA